MIHEKDRETDGLGGTAFPLEVRDNSSLHEVKLTESIVRKKKKKDTDIVKAK